MILPVHRPDRLRPFRWLHSQASFPVVKATSPMFDPSQGATQHPESTRSGLVMVAAQQRCRGFSAIELLTVIAVLGILVAMALPSFNNTIRRFRVNSASTEITNVLQFARSQAIATRKQVNVAQTTNPDSSCTSADTTDWHCGIDVYVDAGTTIKTIPSSDFKNVNVRINTGVISYNPLGFSTLTNGFAPTYVWLSSDGANPATAPYANTVCIGVGGKVKTFPSYLATCSGV